jgi:hypothetical protein
VKTKSHDEVVKDEKGRPIYRIRQLRNCVALLLPVERLPASALNSIRRALSTIMAGVPLQQTSRAQTVSPVTSVIALEDVERRAAMGRNGIVWLSWLSV